MSKKKFGVAGLLIVVALSIFGLYLYLSSKPSVSEEKKFEVTVNLDNRYVKMTCEEDTPAWHVLYGVLQEGGQYYVVPFAQETSNENGLMIYRYPLSEKPEEDLSSDIPPIRQDNAGENFCFYTFHRTGAAGGLPLEPGGEPTPVYSPWWDWTLDLDDGETFTLTLLLPEGYEPRKDAAQLGEARESYGDNEFSIFTTATELTRRMEGGRWRVEASWTKGTFNKLIRDFYLEVQYRKGVTIVPEGTLTVIVLIGVVIAALLVALIYLWRLRKRRVEKRPFLSRRGYVR